MKIFFAGLVGFLIGIFISFVNSTVITAINGKINCDGIICPRGSVTCTVSKKTSDDLNVYKYNRTCFDANGIPTESKVEELPNPYPGTPLDSVSTTGGTLTEEQKKELERQLENQQKYWDQWALDFNKNLQNMFPPGFPFN